jgi:hypothetical protein
MAVVFLVDDLRDAGRVQPRSRVRTKSDVLVRIRAEALRTTTHAGGRLTPGCRTITPLKVITRLLAAVWTNDGETGVARIVEKQAGKRLILLGEASTLLRSEKRTRQRA